ncbi:electron transport complex protein RnfC [Geothermobacter ehrlichii]|uniref:Ion-translocating oxidoreductase complex subunit C n=1 Tax=Geothermobacter ehrlichii TaxID=213224 RepID=A0A5D3WJ29_9BACT|nr:electron transport complex subunit RsxC [Geothermobacter ehrlichii]TYO95461.1 electron transport complex protein RnfC [Geothermobacter ehrlichii]
MRMKTFSGGLHPPDSKEFTATRAIEDCPLPEELVVPLSQHIGAPATACVQAGDRVRKGQVIGEAGGFVSVPVHAPTSGEVVAVEPRPHPSGRALPAVVIRADGEDAWDEPMPLLDPAAATVDELRGRIRDAGIVGMGGATFPTHVKLSPPPEKPIDTLILNGVECEPYLTADHRLMLEESERILDGIAILQKILGVERTFLGIEANKPDAIERMASLGADRSIEVVPLEVKYPQGAEKQLISAIAGREVPSGGLPMDVGVVVQNVGTCAAIADAVLRGRPLIERIATVAGAAVKQPKNLRIRIGMSLRHLVEACGGTLAEPAKIIMGGPMMGMAQLSLDVPATRGTSGLLLFTAEQVLKRPEGPCIRCARCVQACPARILPTSIAAYARLEMMDEAEALGALDCIECGCCSYSCPAALPLVQSIRHAKAAITARRRKG